MSSSIKSLHVDTQGEAHSSFPSIPIFPVWYNLLLSSLKDAIIQILYPCSPSFNRFLASATFRDVLLAFDSKVYIYEYTCTKDTLSLHNSGQRDEWMHTSMRIVCDTFVKLCFSHWSIPKIWSLWSYLPLQFQAFNRPQTKTWAYSHPSSISLLHTLTLSQTTASKMRESFSVTSSGVNRRYFCGFLVAKPECR